ncbi:hypothetical protein [Nostoc sp. MS1]|uniref:hypothetical protein n=1 Tax=Nostoc sp. MS1 TaxID=2764711 RepID=UPI001CC6ED54|nr:hypothetical protein [Nostoc sp. MS1]BCL37684.1 hypothetical protein NSMS1_41310 [Nostoc sp. MS1]
MKLRIPFIILAIGLGIYASGKANADQISQNQQYLYQQTRPLNQQSTSQKLWESFRQQQDQYRLQQQQRLDQFRFQDQIRQQQNVPMGMDQLRQQQNQQMDTLRLQQQLQQR